MVGTVVLWIEETQQGSGCELTFKRAIRCAIYTRKSSEEGLEQSFNSLQAQREACEAYIASQKHEGWHAISTLYDDGGFSGGSIERPALRSLLADIAAGKVNTVVVYKVDRLTRSLADFAKIIEAFDAKDVSFVSVTQQFNTTTSMGRLTLNVLLSFAQFEREVTGERIRDKVAASKKKGMWMGGFVPLGYDLHERQLGYQSGRRKDRSRNLPAVPETRTSERIETVLGREERPQQVAARRFGNHERRQVIFPRCPLPYPKSTPLHWGDRSSR
jgi:DNA invertase Pin-like site-specific DNA recombinase